MVLARFLPQDERFFDYFQKGAANAAEVAQALRDLFDNYSEVERKARRVRDLEHRADEITHQIYDALNRIFVTPFDREDITDLAGRLDDFVVTTIGKGFVPPSATTQLLVIAVLLAAIAWDLITWRYGIPSSSSHALIFSIAGSYAYF